MHFPDLDACSRMIFLFAKDEFSIEYFTIERQIMPPVHESSYFFFNDAVIRD